MVLVSAYKNLKKRDPGFSHRTFAPLRAVGLAVELGWALAKDLGFPSVKAPDLSQVEVFGRNFGDLLVNGAPSGGCKLQLQPGHRVLPSKEKSETQLRSYRSSSKHNY